MDSELKVTIFEEREILHVLLELLDKQYELVLSKNVMELENVSNELSDISRKLAAIELKRRDLIKEIDFIDSLEKSQDMSVKSAFESIKSTIKNIQLQKYTNDILIKQQLFFTNKMINVIKSPDNIGTYNALGKIGR